MKALEIKNLYKSLGKREIIKDLSLEVNEGEIFGFLGPNGAGKTTTIRMIVGLINQDKGTIRIMDKDLKTHREEALRNVGAVVENPELYKYLSGRENLMQIARIRKVSKDRVEEVIKLVGLEGRIDDKVKKYSLGMKQRLGLGAALLSNPKLLILDEPTNGLDPNGIIEFREIVKRAALRERIAVFVSSHILSEVEQLCDRVAFINHGTIKSVESINKSGMDTEEETVVLLTRNEEVAMTSLPSIERVISFNKKEEGIIIKVESGQIPGLVKDLVAVDIEVDEIYRRHRGLEQRYMEIMEGGEK
ncbi:ABC transporter ATP-binding protein [Clostridium hydrogeniformans]|uniref:ABC transporter ATP-binding protein n=1 Tax=Clostridium hydrogeniformans TaxID=349933 RepID=UPI00047FF48E|nr:ABC transporter ATP-binding protein [Clostridium hydrogeniformans]